MWRTAARGEVLGQRRDQRTPAPAEHRVEVGGLQPVVADAAEHEARGQHRQRRGPPRPRRAMPERAGRQKREEEIAPRKSPVEVEDRDPHDVRAAPESCRATMRRSVARVNASISSLVFRTHSDARATSREQGCGHAR
jgi:hypothetical protein